MVWWGTCWRCNGEEGSPTGWFLGGHVLLKGNGGDELMGWQRHGPEHSPRYSGVRQSLPWRRSDQGRLGAG
jgi:hypothetical protein